MGAAGNFKLETGIIVEAIAIIASIAYNNISTRF